MTIKMNKIWKLKSNHKTDYQDEWNLETKIESQDRLSRWMKFGN